MTDVEVTSRHGAVRVEQREFVALSLRHIVLAMPVNADEAEPGGERARIGGARWAGRRPVVPDPRPRAS